MANKKEFSFGLAIIAIILGFTLFKQFDFQTLTMEKPALGMVYLGAFAISVYLLFKDKKETTK